MTKQPAQWGQGRVAVIAQLESIKQDIAKGLPLTVIFRARQASLGGIGYSAFRRLVAVYVNAPASKQTDTTAAIPAAPKEQPSAQKSFQPDGEIDAERIRRLTGKFPGSK